MRRVKRGLTRENFAKFVKKEELFVRYMEVLRTSTQVDFRDFDIEDVVI
jgi:hypothetical protein